MTTAISYTKDGTAPTEAPSAPGEYQVEITVTDPKGNFTDKKVTADISILEPTAVQSPDESHGYVYVYSRTIGSSESIAHISASDNLTQAIENGMPVTVTAEDKSAEGYTFLGWYKAVAIDNNAVTAYGEKVSAKLAYTFEVNGSEALVAVYQPSGSATVKIAAINGAQYTVGDDPTVQSGSTVTVPLGSVLKLKATDASKVLQWQNESNKLLGTGETLEVTVTGGMTVTLVYKTAKANQAFVQFVSDYDQVMQYGQYSTSSTITYPTAPTKLGYVFDKWVFAGTDEEATTEAILAKIGTESLLTLKPSYIKENTECTVTVKYEGCEQDDSTYTLIKGESSDITAPAIDGCKFAYWKDADGTILGYGRSYFMVAQGDITLTAVYVDVNTDVVPVPVITLGKPYCVITNGERKVACAATRSVPNGYSVEEVGMLYARDSAVTESEFVYDNSNILKYQSDHKEQNGVVIMNVKVDSEDVKVSFRGYMVLKNTETGETVYYYTSLVDAKYYEINE